MSKTPKSIAEKLAMKAASDIRNPFNGYLHGVDQAKDVILTTIPIVEYEELRQACKSSGCSCQVTSLDENGETLYGHGRLIKECDFCKALANLDAKLKEI